MPRYFAFFCKLKCDTMNFEAYRQRVLFFFSFCDPKMTSHFSGLKAISQSLSQDSSLIGKV